MTNPVPRSLLAVSATVLALGGLAHAAAFNKAAAAIASSNLLVFYGNAFKALWLIDSRDMGRRRMCRGRWTR